MIILGGSNELKEVVAKAVVAAHDRASKEARELLQEYGTAAALKKKITEMEIQQAKKQEEWDRREREVEHKVGLERKRQEVEVAQTKRETMNEVREENLKAEKERFKSEMNFQRHRLEEEVSSLRELVQEMLKRLPSAEIVATIGKRR